MPIIQGPRWKVDYAIAGNGSRVILLHSSVSGNRQWRSLMRFLAGSYQLVAPNLFGYGQSSRWNSDRSLTLDDQVALIAPLLEEGAAPITLVGHSFGGAVAMRASMRYSMRITRLLLIEPNPFHLLNGGDWMHVHSEIAALYSKMREAADQNDWESVAAPFADYWNGAGTWEAMSRERQIAFSWGMPPVVHEWGAVLEHDSLTSAAADIAAETTVFSARDTVAAIRGIVATLKSQTPHWRFVEVSEGGHMFPVERPELANPLIAEVISGPQPK